MAEYAIAAIPGDGIGKEVLPEAIAVVEKAGSKVGATFKWEEFNWSCESYTKTGKMMPEDGIEVLSKFDIFRISFVNSKFWSLNPLPQLLESVHSNFVQKIR